MISELELADLLQGLNTKEWKALNNELGNHPPNATFTAEHSLQQLAQNLSIELKTWHEIKLVFNFVQAEFKEILKQPITGCQLNWPDNQQQVIVEVSNALALQLVEQLFGGELMKKPPIKPALTMVEQQVAQNFAMEVVQHTKQFKPEHNRTPTGPIQKNLKTSGKWLILKWDVQFETADSLDQAQYLPAVNQLTIYLNHTFCRPLIEKLAQPA